MIKKTKDYDMFILRKDNRNKIDLLHVSRLVESIKLRNLLEMRPIVVNETMEVMDGQHRLLAAKELGIEIYYEQQVCLNSFDIIRMNISKSWGMGDFMNFYCEHDYPEYKKLAEFMKRNNLTLKVAFCIACGQVHQGYHDFKTGKFRFHEEGLDPYLQICWETIDYIKKMNGFSPYTYSSRFWKPLLKLVRHPEFDRKKWLTNMQRMIEHFCPKPRSEDYAQMMQNVYNWRSNCRISILETDI